MGLHGPLLPIIAILCLATITTGYYYRPRCGRHRPRILNGYYTLEDRTNNVIRAHCTSGFQLIGSERRFCDVRRGRYSGDEAICRDVDECRIFEEGSGDDAQWPDEVSDRPPCHVNATCLNTMGRYRCECHMGHYGDGTNCSPLPCAYPDVPNSVMVRRGQGYLIHFRCNEHHSLRGNDVLRCDLRTRQWNHEPPRCEPYPRCPEPIPMDHGSIHYRSQTPYFIGTQIGFMCDEGYQLHGPYMWQCAFGLIWEGQDETYCKKLGLEMMGDSLRQKLDYAARNSKGSEAYNENARFSPYDPRGVDVIFLLDSSSSILKSNFDKGIEFLTIILEELQPGKIQGDNITGFSRVAAITFSDAAKVEFSLKDSQSMTVNDIIGRLKAINPSGGGTNLKGGLQTVRQHFFRQRDALRVLFIISDGEADDMTGIENTALGMQDRQKVEIFALGVGSFIRREQLQKVSSKPTPEHLFLLSDYDQLSNLKDYIIDKRTDSQKCGFNGIKPGPVFGFAPRNGWPWNVLLTITKGNMEVSCGGTLICQNWVITSAQCVRHQRRTVQPAMISVRLGLSSDEVFGIEAEVASVVVHAQYMDLFPHVHDLALLRLGEQVPLSRAVRTACMLQPDTLEVQRRLPWTSGDKRDEQYVYNTGWGTTEDDLQLARALLSYDKTQFMGDDDCSAVIDGVNITDPEHRQNLGCLKSHSKYCYGDIGGPVVWNHTVYYLAGVPTYNSRCDQAGSATIVTKLRNYLTWIKETTANCNANYAEKVVSPPDDDDK